MTDSPSEAMGGVAVPSFGGFSGATLHLAIDHAEHQRRQAAGLTVAVGHGFGGLDILMALPHELPVPLDSLDKRQRAYIHRAPAGICTVHDGHVTRHATRPCRVTLATVRHATACQLALTSVERFTPFCARRIVIHRIPRRAVDRAQALIEFGFYGIGVVLEHKDGTEETLIEPAPWRPKRHTPAAWWFAENAYAAYLQAHTDPKTV